ncbi:MAG: response regulator transcription factor [Chloroflexota bacterium]
MTAAIRVAIVDDHPVLREGTAALLAAQPGLEIAGVADSVDAAEALVASTPVDVVLLDIRLGSDSGLRWLTQGSPDTPARSDGLDHPRPAIVVLTSYDYPQYAEAALRLGASGFVLKTAPIAELLDAIRRAAAGGLAFGVRPARSGPLTRLSGRELDVVRLVVDGHSNDEIAARLGIGTKTVESHLRRLFERFDLASRTELATRALREGWLEVPPGG